MSDTPVPEARDVIAAVLGPLYEEDTEAGQRLALESADAALAALAEAGFRVTRQEAADKENEQLRKALRDVLNFPPKERHPHTEAAWDEYYARRREVQERARAVLALYDKAPE